MKNVLTLIMLLSSGAAVMAQEGSEITGMDISSSDHPYTSVCIAATESRDALEEALQDNGFTPFEAREIYCNDKPLQQFAREIRNFKEATSGKLVVVKTDESPETGLCLNLLTSDNNQSALEIPATELRCNGMPLDRFMLRYGRKEIVKIL